MKLFVGVKNNYHDVVTTTIMIILILESKVTYFQAVAENTNVLQPPEPIR
jgi:hypothetical protein